MCHDFCKKKNVMCGKFDDYLYVYIYLANFFVPIARQFSLFYLPAKISLFRISHAAPSSIFLGSV
jgi:hypothetical protein